MKRFLTAVGQYHLATTLLVALGLNAFGCADSATVNPVVELASLSVSPGTLQPAFSGGTTQYRVDLTNDIATVTITAQPAVAGDTVSINGQRTTSRTITLEPAGETTVVNVVVSEADTNSRTYVIRLVRAGLAGNNSLQNLTISPGTPPLVFNENTLSYSVTVGNTVNSVTVTPTLQDPLATMTVNGQAATSGQARTITPLSPAGQSTTITILVTAQNGTEKPYTIAVSRGVSNNNNLQGLTISLRASNPTLNQTLNPSFSPGTAGYTVNLPATLPSDVTNVRVTPTLQDTTASMTVNTQPATSGQAQLTPLPAPGQNTFITIVVTAQDRSQQTYTVNVIRAALGGNNNLSDLTVSPGPLVPPFTSDTTTYSLAVVSTVTSVTVTPTLQDPAATLTVTSNGQVATSGQAYIITLRAAGLSTTINIVVTAQNGSQKPYTITVDRAASMAPPAPADAPNMTAATDSGISDDNITNNPTPSFTVAQPAAGETPNLYVDGSIAKQGFDLGANTLTPTAPLSNGNHTITSTVTNSAGLQSPQSPFLTVTIDPAAP